MRCGGSIFMLKVINVGERQESEKEAEEMKH